MSYCLAHAVGHRHIRLSMLYRRYCFKRSKWSFQIALGIPEFPDAAVFARSLLCGSAAQASYPGDHAIFSVRIEKSRAMSERRAIGSGRKEPHAMGATPSNAAGHRQCPTHDIHPPRDRLGFTPRRKVRLQPGVPDKATASRCLANGPQDGATQAAPSWYADRDSPADRPCRRPPAPWVDQPRP